jgi:hypothetical protein
LEAALENAKNPAQAQDVDWHRSEPEPDINAMLEAQNFHRLLSNPSAAGCTPVTSGGDHCMTPEERADFEAAIAWFRMNPWPPPSIYISGLGWMLLEGYHNDRRMEQAQRRICSEGRAVRFEPDGRQTAQGTDGNVT